MPRISFVLLLLAGLVPTVSSGQNSSGNSATIKSSSGKSSSGKAASSGQTSVNPLSRGFLVDSIAVEGNRILSSQGIIQASGIRKGQPASSEVFDDARDQLIATGYFDTVAYRYKPSGSGGYDLVFEVQEITALYPIRIDGLPVSAAEVTIWLKSRDPLFTGRMPGTQQVLQRTAHEIEEYLRTRGRTEEIAGKVIATAPEHLEVDFTPLAGLPAVSMVAFEGSKVISAVDLHNKISEVAFGQPFTENAFRMLLESQIVPLYEAKGYLRVTFPKITTKPATDVKGVDVTVEVNEGTEYKLVRVAVTGGSQSENERILKSAKLPQMTVADAGQVRDASIRVRNSLRHQGFLDAEVKVDRKVDDEKKTVQFFLVVDMGPEYTFGMLAVNGLGLDGEAAIKKMWGLRPGDAFPEGYGDYFLGKVKEAGIFDNLGDMKSASDINRDAHVVNVALDFKGSPSKQPSSRGRGGMTGPQQP